MLKKSCLIAAAAVGIASLGPNQAMAEGGYLAAGGVSLIQGDGALQDFDLNANSNVGAFGSVGYRWDRAFGAEVEGGLRSRSVFGNAPIVDGIGATEETGQLMLNARIAPETHSPFRPYAGFGAGFLLVNTADYNLHADNSEVAAAGQAMAGFSIELTDRTSFFAEYRYLKRMDAAERDSNIAGRSHAGFIGLHVTLGDFKR